MYVDGWNMSVSGVEETPLVVRVASIALTSVRTEA